MRLKTTCGVLVGPVLPAVVLVGVLLLAGAAACDPAGAGGEGKAAAAAEGAKDAGGAADDAGATDGGGELVAIFNGKDLTGWEVTGCVTNVEDGVLVVKDGNGFVRYDKELADFVLEVEYKPVREKDYDSGLFFRAALPKDKPWPDRYQVNLKQGDEGNLIGSKSARSEGLVKPGEWNTFRLKVVGKTASLAINGKPAWQTDEIAAASGYFGIQVEVPGGGQFQFRNIKLKTL